MKRRRRQRQQPRKQRSLKQRRRQRQQPRKQRGLKQRRRQRQPRKQHGSKRRRRQRQQPRKQRGIEAEAQQAALAAQTAAISAEELKLLANIIYCEAGSESYVGKVAVGNVIMNRVKSASQPNTITEVVYAKGQFSPVRNGSLQRALSSDKADAACYQAAIEALAGAQPVGGKLFFRRNNGRSGQVIGHHVFY